jgi:DNA-3-methyladenine glycosylase II
MKKPSIVNEDDIRLLLKKEKIFSTIHKLYGPPPSWSREPGFVSLTKIILEQQVSLESAAAHFKKLQDYIGEMAPVGIMKLTDEEMRTCQISRQKAKYLRALSEAILKEEIDLEGLTHREEPDR